MTTTADASLVSVEISRTEKAHTALDGPGIRALMLAVLEDAIHCLRSPLRLRRADAERWINSPERRHLFSFRVICETLNLEASAVRRRVTRLLEQKKGTGGRLLRRSRPNVRHRGAMQVARRRAARRPTQAYGRLWSQSL